MRLLDEKELLASQCLPTTRSQSRVCNTPYLDLGNTSRTQACKMSGNAMHVPSVGAFLMCAFLGLSPKKLHGPTGTD